MFAFILDNVRKTAYILYMTNLMSIDDLLKHLMQRREEEGGTRPLARTLNVSSSYLSDVIHLRQEPGPLLLDKLGIQRHISYSILSKKDDETQ